MSEIDNVFDKLDELFELEEENKIVTDKDVLFTISYSSNGEDVCSEGFLTKRFAAEIAMEEARNKEEEGWVDIVETGNATKSSLLVGSFKVNKKLVSMKIIDKERIEQQAKEYDISELDIEKG